jgi:hypothetical protein
LNTLSLCSTLNVKDQVSSTQDTKFHSQRLCVYSLYVYFRFV